MKGSIRRRSKNSWEITIDAGRHPVTGKRLRHYENIKGRKADAERRLAEFLVSIQKGPYVRPKRLTLGEWLERWLETYVKPNLRPQTVESYEMIARLHLIPALGAIPLNQLKPDHLHDYYGQALRAGRVDGRGGLSGRTVQYHHRIMAEALGHAVRMEILGRNPTDAVTPPRPTGTQIAILALNDVEKFLSAASVETHYPLLHSGLFTGLRLGELLGLYWEDLDLALAELRVVRTLHKRRGLCEVSEPKNSRSRRQIALLPASTTLLRQYKAEQEMHRSFVGKTLSDRDFVFCRIDGTPLDPGTVRGAFNRTLKRAGLPHIRFHDLRHTHATWLLMSDVHPKIVQERLGHSSIAVTLDTYSHVVPGLQVAGMQRLDEFLKVKLARLENVGKMSAK